MPSSAQRAWSPYSPDELSIMTVAPRQLGPLRDFRRDLEPVHVRHVRVEQDELERPVASARPPSSASTAARPLATTVAVIPQRLTCSARMRRLTSLSSTISTSRCGGRGIGRLGLGRVGDVERDGEMKRAAGARLALDPEPSAHQPHERGRDRQAEAGAAEPARRRSVRLTEGFEDGVVLAPAGCRSRCR